MSGSYSLFLWAETHGREQCYRWGAEVLTVCPPDVLFHYEDHCSHSLRLVYGKSHGVSRRCVKTHMHLWCQDGWVGIFVSVWCQWVTAFNCLHSKLQMQMAAGTAGQEPKCFLCHNLSLDHPFSVLNHNVTVCLSKEQSLHVSSHNAQRKKQALQS